MFWERLKCFFLGHDEKLMINEIEPHPMGGFTVLRSNNFCWRCKRPLP